MKLQEQISLNHKQVLEAQNKAKTLEKENDELHLNLEAK